MSLCDSPVLIIQPREDAVSVASQYSEFKDIRAAGNSVNCNKYTVCFSLCMWYVLCCQNS